MAVGQISIEFYLQSSYYVFEVVIAKQETAAKRYTVRYYTHNVHYAQSLYAINKNVRSLSIEVYYPFQQNQIDNFFELIKLRYINSLIKSVKVQWAEYL